MEESEKPSHVDLTTSAEQELTLMVQDDVLDMEVDNETRDLVEAEAAATTTDTPVTAVDVSSSTKTTISQPVDVSSSTKSTISQPGHSLRTLSLTFKENGEKLTAKLANTKK